nr:IMEF encapsulin system ferritin-like cargo protein [Bacillus piscicola]
MEDIFHRTRDALNEFKDIITPVIENAEDDHERLYWHHIYEEEDHRLDRLEHLLPELETVKGDSHSLEDREKILLLQDISLEKFGLHNFLEHLDLSLYTFTDSEAADKIRELRDMTAADYETTKALMDELNEEFKGNLSFNASVPTDEKENVNENLKVEAYASASPSAEANSEPDTPDKPHEYRLTRTKKQLTVGSLKNN